MQHSMIGTGFFAHANLLQQLRSMDNFDQEFALQSRLFCDSFRHSMQHKRRVNLLIDVSHLHHSHIIGKGGRNVKSISERTKCNIHFPDSNRANIPDKSNQVFISGPVPGINEAREIIRSMLPVFVSFRVVIPKGLLQTINELMRLIESRYSVEIFVSDLVTSTSFPQSQHQLSFIINVKAISLQLNSIAEATNILLHQIFNEESNNVRIKICIEIDPRHQERMLVTPRNIAREILLSTGCEIHFPERNHSMNLFECPIEKSTVVLHGPKEGIFRAHQIVMDNLPVKMSFDITEDEFNYVQQMDQNEIRTKYGVTISVKLHRKYEQRRNVQIFTIEKNMQGLIDFYNAVIQEPQPMYSKIHLIDENKENDPYSISCRQLPTGMWPSTSTMESNSLVPEACRCKISSPNEDKEGYWNAIAQNLINCMDEKNE